MTDGDDTESGNEPSSFNAQATAKMLGLSAKQLAWCLATLKGANQTAAARSAGYEGTPEQLRSAGSRIARSAKVQRFLELAALEGGDVGGATMDVEEQRRQLSKMARGTDKNSAIRAIEVLHRLDLNERAAQEARDQNNDPKDCLEDIAAISPFIAYHLAQHYQMPWTPTPERAAAIEEARRSLAVAWLDEQKSKAMPQQVNA